MTGQREQEAKRDAGLRFGVVIGNPPLDPLRGGDKAKEQPVDIPQSKMGRGSRGPVGRGERAKNLFWMEQTQTVWWLPLFDVIESHLVTLTHCPRNALGLFCKKWACFGVWKGIRDDLTRVFGVFWPCSALGGVLAQ